MDTETKTCSKCGKVKPVDAFGKHRWCKQCKRVYDKARREANPEKGRAQVKAWREANPEKNRAYKKAYREANAEKIRAYRIDWYKDNAEKGRARAKAWYEANLEKARLNSLGWHKANPDRSKANIKNWRIENPEKVRAHAIFRRDSLTTSYVKHMIAQGTPIKEVPQSLIDLKRVQVLITRKLKECKK